MITYVKSNGSPLLNPLDLKIKTEVFGFKLTKEEQWGYCEWLHPNGKTTAYDWLDEYSTKLKDTMRVIKFLIKKGYVFRIFYNTDRFNAKITSKEDWSSYADGKTAAEAICKAAINVAIVERTYGKRQ